MTTNNVSAVILAEGPNGLGAVRSLSQKNISVETISFKATDPSLYSRLPKKKSIIERDKELLLNKLLQKENTGQVLIPTSDWCVNFLVEFQSELKNKYKFVLPQADLSSKFIDKKIEVELVDQWTDVPQSILTLPDTPKALIAIIDFPIIIKPRSNEMNYLGQKNIIVNNAQELENFYQKFSQYLEYCIAQEIIQGDDDTLWVCNCVFDNNSNLVNAFTFQRLYLAPAHFGVTSYATSKLNTDVIKSVEKLGKGLNYIGPAMVEFKYDKKDNIYKYIEVNPRLGLCNYFDTSCGKNNVYATYCLAKDLTFIEQPQKEGRMFLSAYEDLFSRLSNNQPIFSILKTYASNILKPHNFIYFSWNDPWPSIRIGLHQTKLALRSIMKKFNKEIK